MKKAYLLAIIVLVIFALCLFTGCDEDQKTEAIVGSWGNNNWVYTFNEDGTGDYSGSGLKYSTSGDKINIYYSGSESPSSFNYKIEDDTLTFIDSFGSSVVYKKK